MTTIDSSPATPTAESQHGCFKDKKRYLDRLNILTQISAHTSALQGVALGLVDDHFKQGADATWLGGPTAT